MNIAAIPQRAPTQERPDLGKAARLYAEKLGWPVAPAHWIVPNGNCSCGKLNCSSPGKHPFGSLVPHGLKDATNDLDTISRWWNQYPEANILVPTGSASRIWVLDVDPLHGGDSSLADIEAQENALPPTWEQVTGSDGRHIVFKYPEDAPEKPGLELRNTAGKLGPGLDTRGEGGYIIIAPSSHKSGNLYRWKKGRRPSQVKLADIPNLLLDRLRKRESKTPQQDAAAAQPGGPRAYAETALADEVKATATAREGARNDQLNASAFALGQLVGADLLDRGRVGRALTDAAQTTGLLPAEIEQTLRSGLDAGMAEPREVPVADLRRPSPGSAGAQRALAPADITAPSSAAWPPPLDERALYGLAGEFVRTVEPHSEADPIALLVQFLVAYGSAVGRGPHFVAEADRHGVNLDAVFVGETSKGRKGTSWGHVHKVFTQADPEWDMRIKSGLSSGEGLIWEVRDEIRRKEPIRDKGRVTDYQEVITDEGVKDKRLLVFEGEFASVLRVCGRDGNTLSAIVRNAWDTGNLRTLTKNSPAVATGAHISIIGHITKDELLRYLDDTEAANGFGNRFLWLCVRRSKALPEGGSLAEEELAPIIREVQTALAYGRNLGEMRRTDKARSIWCAVYEDLSEGKPGLLGAIIARAEAQVMRLACIYALLDRSPSIGKEHLLAALALWEYVEASARYIFGQRMGDPVADRIADALQYAPDGLTRTEISALFKRHQSSNSIDRALGQLRVQQIAEAVRDETSGRPSERWRLCAR